MREFELQVWFFCGVDEKDCQTLNVEAENEREAVEQAKKIIAHPLDIYNAETGERVYYWGEYKGKEELTNA